MVVLKKPSKKQVKLAKSKLAKSQPRLDSAKWKDEWYVKCYQLARSGATDKQIAEALKVSPYRFDKWVDLKSALRYALEQARDMTNQQAEYIYGRLSERAKECWKKVGQAEDEHNTVVKIDLLFDKYGEGIRKELFLHALANTHFNPSQACKKVHIPYTRFKKWVDDDYEFAMAVNEMQEHKGNLYESKLVELVMDGDPAAVLHVNRTFNRNRGYADKLQVEHTGKIVNEHVIELGDSLLERLSKPARKELLQVVDALQIEEQKKNGEFEA